MTTGKQCIKCGSHAFNLYKDGIDQGSFCDVHYWQGRAHRAEALAQPAQEPVAWIAEFENGEQELHFEKPTVGETITPLYTTPPAAVMGIPTTGDYAMGYAEGFNDACKRPAPPQQRPWIELTFAEICECENDSLLKFARAIEAALKEKNA